MSDNHQDSLLASGRFECYTYARWRMWWNGRHRGLKIPWLQNRAGSSPAIRTQAPKLLLLRGKKMIDIRHDLWYSNKAVGQTACGLVAQLDRVFDYESKGRGFESRRAH